MSDTKDCSNCASMCKKDSPCSFYQKRKRSKMGELLDELTIHYNANRELYRVEGETEEEQQIHGEEMEAMWRDQQHEPPEDYHDEGGVYIDTSRTNLRVRDEDGNDRE